MSPEDTLIVGAGPIGLACAISAKRRGVDPLVIDAGAVVNSILHYPIGMSFFTTPDRLEIGGHPVVCSGEKPTRREALMYYREVVRAEALRVLTYTKLVGARHTDAGLLCELESRSASAGADGHVQSSTSPESRFELQTERLVLATGYFDHPNALEVPGDDLPHVFRYFDEAHASYNLDVVVIGGKNSAVEAALQLYRAGARTTLVYRRSEFTKSVKYWLKPDIENRMAGGEIAGRLGADVLRIEKNAVVILRSDGETERLKADRVYALIGFQPDTELFRRVGIEIEPETGVPRHDPDTLETNVPGVYVAGSITSGYRTSDIFIENGRFDGEKIFRD
ncbi:MAG: YpdA family putative bacillithiol disulfide reductase [Gemmatimonadales bacterium]